MVLSRRALSACAFLAVVAAYDNAAPHSRFPVLGWSSWVALGPGDAHPIFDFCDEQSVLAAVDAYHEVGLYDAGYRHFHLDDCWAGGRNSTGHVFPEADHFPNGMKKIIDYVHSKNMSFGLYTCGGTKTCVGNRPGSEGKWDLDAEVYAEWGVDWVKMDWCNSKPQDPKETYPIMSKAMNKTGRHMHFNMCEWGDENPWEWGFDCAQSWRMAGDHTPVWESTKKQIQLSAAIPAEYTGKPFGWNDMDMLETGNYEQAAHANGKEGTMTAEEYMTEFSMWSISASPLTVTTPIMNCSSETPAPSPTTTCNVTLSKKQSQASCEEGTSFGCNNDGTMWTKDGCRGEFMCNGKATKCSIDGTGTHTCVCGPAGPVKCKGWISDLQKKILLNSEVIDINQQASPQGRPVDDKDMSLWLRDMDDGSKAVALYNQEDSPISVAVDFAKLGWDADTSAAIRDLWEHKDLGSFKGKYPASGNVTVAPHNTILLRLTKA